MYKISFKENSDYFKESRILKAIKKSVTTKLIEVSDSRVVALSFQLFMESVIKHNLDINMLGINQVKFLSEDNSKEVFSLFSKIVEKQKTERSYDDLKTLRIQGEIEDEIATYCYEKDKRNIDICEAIKKEFTIYVQKNKLN